MLIGDRNRITYSLLKAFFEKDIGYTKVRLSDFHLCDHPVTCEEWSAVMKSNPPSDEMKRVPKTGVTWHQVQEFIFSLNKITGWNFRLPTEYEWEYAARGGEFDEHVNFAGNQSLAQVGWFEGNAKKIQPVSQKMPNILGLYDMSGNVWEWCQNWFVARYEVQYKALFSLETIPIDNPLGPDVGTQRVIRGGSYSNKEQKCMVFWRTGWKPNRSAENLGFRLAY